MNVSQQNIDNVNAVIKIEITKADYQEKVDKALRTYRQKANIPGFRRGMVPMGMVKKMFGKSVLVEEINKEVSEQLYNHIKENKLNILGEPLPSAEQKNIDFDTQEDFEFSFDIALAPEIKVDLNKNVKVDYYNIKIDDEMVKKQCDAMANRFGTQIEVETAGDNDMIRGKLTELAEDGTVKEDGIAVESTIVSPSHFKNDDEKAKFAGVKVGDKVVFNPSNTCNGLEVEMASMLHISKEQAADVKSDFEMEVTGILGFKPAEMGQELFDNVFGKDVVKTEEEYIAKIKEMLAAQLSPESDYKFSIDARKVIEKKVGNVELPEEFLKRWLVASGENRTPESIEEEYPKMLPDLKWHLIKEQIVRDLNIKVEDADVLEMAKKVTQAQFAQYGMANVPADILEKYATDMLKDKNAVRNIVDRATEEKITKAIKEKVKLNEKEIALDDFYKLFENK
ncbi:trigger factor [Coprobacter tertius]|uniref:Trigger factor n=1 Tax=Coprobacter tertius TaxID=2944915 RepID=A0ABT1MIG5_9BACT|nr:trigger factor [Coprobacter tertius]MCP9612179.1 trigger factor [Coprobacter tertius]